MLDDVAVNAPETRRRSVFFGKNVLHFALAATVSINVFFLGYGT